MFLFCLLQMFKEVPSVGIFKMTCSQEDSSMKKRITLFPWKDAVWPGSLDPVKNTPELAANLATGGCIYTMYMHTVYDF